MELYDLVVRGGTVVDGSGGPSRVTDIAVKDGKIVTVGTTPAGGREEIDARGKIVTPGFVDIHTHYDGQVTWAERLQPSSAHGVTTVVMGNCGVGFAPCRPQDREKLIHLLEGVEDIPEIVMTRGLPWNWETFPEYLDALEARQLDIDFATQVPHAAIRVYVMGQRGADREPPTASELEEMTRLTEEGIRAGALGVSTSRSLNHRTRDGDLAPTITGEERELLALAAGIRAAGTGVVQIVTNNTNDPKTEFALMRRLAEAANRPLSFTLLDGAQMPGGWATMLKQLEQAQADDVPMLGQVFPRPIGILYGLALSLNPFSFHPSFQEIADLDLAEKVRIMRDPKFRARLLREEPEHSNPFVLGLVKRVEELYPLGDPLNYEPTPDQNLAAEAVRTGVSLCERIYDRLLEDEGRAMLYFPVANFSGGNSEAIQKMLEHPFTVIGLGDAGAHYGLICDASYTTYMLTRWSRDASPESRQELGNVVRALTSHPASVVGLDDRGLIRPGYKADLNIIDLNRLHLNPPDPVRDLPANGLRLHQHADGYVATIVSGKITYREGEPTGELPGRLVRWAQPSPLAA